MGSPGVSATAKTAPAGKLLLPKPVTGATDGGKRMAATTDDGSKRLATVPQEMSPARSQVTPQLTPAHVTGRHVHQQGPRRHYGWLRSLLLFVVLPVLVAAIYFGLIASDQYVSRAKYAIRGQNAPAAEGSSLARLGGASMGSGLDMIIVREYIMSRQMLEDIRPHLDLRTMYSNPKVDRLSRLQADLPEEELLEYWRSMVTVHDDPLSGFTELMVRAFTPEDAKAIAERVLLLSEALVNRLSERSLADALAMSKKEAALAYDRVTQARDAMQAFQKSTRQIDPAGFAKGRAEIQARLESDLVGYQAQLTLLRRNLPEGAPAIVQLANRNSVVEDQLAAERAQSTSSASDESASDILGGFDKLRVDYEFAEKAYLSALASLESARVSAIRQGRYLEPFVRPQLPEYPEFPRRIRGVLLTALAALLIWAVGSLFVATAKEHL